MQTFSNSTTTTPTVAEQQPPVTIPAPCVGASKKLQSEFVKLHRADFLIQPKKLRSDFAAFPARAETLEPRKD